MIPMLDGVQRQRLRPTFTQLELAFIGLALACLAGQFFVYRGPHPGTAARVGVIVLDVGVFGFSFAMLASIMRRARAQARGTPG